MPIETNGHLDNPQLTSLVKKATGIKPIKHNKL